MGDREAAAERAKEALKTLGFRPDDSKETELLARDVLALVEQVATLEGTLQLAEGLTLLHDVETDDDPESFADLTGFDRIDCKACLFNVARGKADRRDPAKVAALVAGGA